MLKEIDRIGLISAGVVCGALCAALCAILGTVGLVAAASMGEAWLTESAAEMTGSGALAPGEAGSVLALSAIILLAAATVAVLIGGFAFGVFLAALYNVTAGITGGLRLTLRDP